MDRSDNQTGCIRASASSTTKGCLKVHVSRIGEAIRATCSALGGIAAQCLLLNPPFRVASGLVCDVINTSGIRFTLSGLRWNGADNNAGVTKYNTLISSGDWSLEEVEIEELL